MIKLSRGYRFQPKHLKIIIALIKAKPQCLRYPEPVAIWQSFKKGAVCSVAT
jgi:hypothetical protein